MLNAAQLKDYGNSDHSNQSANDFDLVFDTFPRVYGIIRIPDDGKNYYIYRASGRNPIQKNDDGTCPPRFFSREAIADKYVKNGIDMYRCKLKTNTKLVDIRTLKYMFLDYIEDGAPGLTEFEAYKYMTVLGLLPHNIQKLTYDQATLGINTKNKYEEFSTNKPGPLAYTGSRLSYRPFDDAFVLFCKNTFKGIDGYIAPTLKRPSGKNCMFHAEICLFDPCTSVEVVPSLTKYPGISLSTLLESLTHRLLYDELFSPRMGGAKKKITQAKRAAKPRKSS